MSYVRFVTDFIDKKSHNRLGIIRSAYRIKDRMSKEDSENVNEIFDWFNDFLEVPHRFSKSKKDTSVKRAVSWFKDDAKKCISKARQLSDILEKYNVNVEMLIAKNPGCIIYEDDEQVAAIPF